MNIMEMKEYMENAKISYKNNIAKAITDVIKETLTNINLDIDNNSYYVETMTCEEAENSGDKLVLDAYDDWYDKMQNSVNECGDKIFHLLWEADHDCGVVSEIFTDNSILFEIQFDDMEFSFEYRNTFNE